MLPSRAGTGRFAASPARAGPDRSTRRRRAWRAGDPPTPTARHSCCSRTLIRTLVAAARASTAARLAMIAPSEPRGTGDGLPERSRPPLGPPPGTEGRSSAAGTRQCADGRAWRLRSGRGAGHAFAALIHLDDDRLVVPQQPRQQIAPLLGEIAICESRVPGVEFGPLLSVRARHHDDVAQRPSPLARDRIPTSSASARSSTSRWRGNRPLRHVRTPLATDRAGPRCDPAG